MRIRDAVIVAALAGAACKTMSPVTLQQLATLNAERVWVTESDQSIVLVSRPQVEGDTLVGYVNDEYEEIPAARLTQVRVLKAAPARTVLLAVGIAAGVGGFAYMITGAIGGHKYVGDDYCDEHPEDPDCAMR